MRFAVLNHPAVAAAYYDWRASVEDIVPARSAPDPQLVFQADIGEALTSLMPGVVFSFTGSGKLAATGREATAAAEVARRGYLSAVLAAAAETRRAWTELAYVDEETRLKELSARALERSLSLAGTDYATARAMGSLGDTIRIGNDLARVRSELGALADRRSAARSRFKSALGLSPADPDPAWPVAELAATPLPGADELWRRASSASPELGRMRAMVEMAVEGAEAARTAGRPDFSVGAMADLRADPHFARPLATLDLPVWRDKIAALLAAAQARREASRARLSGEELTLAAELAQMLYMVREADRTVAYVDHDALPGLERAVATAEAAYQSGTAGPGAIPDVQLQALALRMERAGALLDRESAATELMLLTADAGPGGPPGAEAAPPS